MIKKSDTVLILEGQRAGVKATVLQVFKNKNIKAKVITPGHFDGDVLELVRYGHYTKV